jgi:hypothetical protein
LPHISGQPGGQTDFFEIRGHAGFLPKSVSDRMRFNPLPMSYLDIGKIQGGYRSTPLDLKTQWQDHALDLR